MANLLPFNTFVKGIITEANPLTYPENSSIDEANFVLNVNGSRQRRKGVDIEHDGQAIIFNDAFPPSDPNMATATFEWRNAGQRGDTDILVIQCGNQLRFFLTGEGAISNYPLANDVSWFIDGDESEPMEFSSVLGRLVVVHSQSSVYQYEYQHETLSIKGTISPIKIRDTFGVDSGMGLDERPTAITDEHRYNLLNMGWPELFPTYNEPSPNEISNVTDENPIDATYDHLGYYPSTSDLFYMFKSVSSADGVEEAIGAYNPWLLERYSEGSLQGPQGRAIIDLFARGNSRNEFFENGSTNTGNTGNSGSGGGDHFPPTYPISERSARTDEDLPADHTNGGIASVASYAGRAFYAISVSSTVETDDKSPDLGSMVFFSQVATSLESLTRCHSELDPTAETLNEVLDTDGGYLSIPEAGRILALRPMGTSLIIFGENGVWSVGGGDKVFSAKNLAIHKLSNDGLHAEEAAVVAGDTAMYVSRAGIYKIGIDAVSGYPTATNISETTIQSLLLGVGLERQSTMKGLYDSAERKVRFMVMDETNTRCTDEFIYDLVLGAWYKYTFPQDETAPNIRGYVGTNSPSYITEPEAVTTTGLSNITTSTGELIQVEEQFKVDETAGFTRYLFSNGDALYIGETKVTTFKDFISFGTGYDAPAYLVTGYISGGDTARMKHAPYVLVQAEQTEDAPLPGSEELSNRSGVTLQYMWEWTNSEDTERWSSPFSVYREIPVEINEGGGSGYRVSSVKRKIRGRGRVLSLKFSTEEEKDCILLGWTLEVNVQQKM